MKQRKNRLFLPFCFLVWADNHAEKWLSRIPCLLFILEVFKCIGYFPPSEYHWVASYLLISREEEPTSNKGCSELCLYIFWIDQDPVLSLNCWDGVWWFHHKNYNPLKPFEVCLELKSLFLMNALIFEIETNDLK